MPETITVKIGGEDVTIPAVANFATLERIWPAIDAYNTAPDGIAQIGAACALFSAALLDSRPDFTVAEIKKRLRVGKGEVDERAGLHDGVNQFLLASGLVQPGEAAPAAGGEQSSTAISNTSLPS